VSQQPPDEGEVDELYRRASARDSSAPSESVRNAVLRHAAELAAQRAERIANGAVDREQLGPASVDFKRPAANEARWRPATYGGLAAAALAGLLIAPHLLPPSPPPPAPRVAKEREAAPAPALRALEDQQGPSALPATPTPPPPSPPISPPPATPALPTRPGPSPFAPRASPPAGAAKLASPPAPAPPLDEPAPRALASQPEAFAGNAAQNQAAAREFGSAAKATAGAPSESTALADVTRSMNAAAALRQAAQSGDMTRVDALLDEQVEIDARDASGRTALMLAVLHGQSQVLDALLAHGADPNAADSSGTTPLQAAQAGNETVIIDTLRRAGAR
jgi:Ankyrin repeats (3 copies)